MLVTPYMCSTLHHAQKSPELKLTSLAYFTLFFYFAKKPINVFFEGTILLKSQSITL